MTTVLEVHTQWLDGPKGTGAWEVELSDPSCEYCRGLVDSAITEAKYISKVAHLVMHHTGYDKNLVLTDDHTISVESLSYQVPA